MRPGCIGLGCYYVARDLPASRSGLEELPAPWSSLLLLCAAVEWDEMTGTFVVIQLVRRLDSIMGISKIPKPELLLEPNNSKGSSFIPKPCFSNRVQTSLQPIQIRLHMSE